MFCWERGQNSLVGSRVEVLCTHSDDKIFSERTWEVSRYGGDAPLVLRSLKENEDELVA